MNQPKLDRSKDFQYTWLPVIIVLLWALTGIVPRSISLVTPTAIIPTPKPVFTCSSLKEYYPDNYRHNSVKCWLRFPREPKIPGKTPYVYMIDGDKIHEAWISAVEGNPITTYTQPDIDIKWSPNDYESYYR